MADDKVSGLISLVKAVHIKSTSQRLTLDNSFDYFKDLLLMHSVQRCAPFLPAHCWAGGHSSLWAARCCCPPHMPVHPSLQATTQHSTLHLFGDEADPGLDADHILCTLQAVPVFVHGQVCELDLYISTDMVFEGGG